jgi:hypothetical protein
MNVSDYYLPGNTAHPPRYFAICSSDSSAETPRRFKADWDRTTNRGFCTGVGSTRLKMVLGVCLLPLCREASTGRARLRLSNLSSVMGPDFFITLWSETEEREDSLERESFELLRWNLWGPKETTERDWRRSEAEKRRTQIIKSGQRYRYERIEH